MYVNEAENGSEKQTDQKKIIGWVVGLPAAVILWRASRLAPLVGAVRGNRGAGEVVLFANGVFDETIK